MCKPSHKGSRPAITVYWSGKWNWTFNIPEYNHDKRRLKVPIGIQPEMMLQMSSLELRFRQCSWLSGPCFCSPFATGLSGGSAKSASQESDWWDFGLSRSRGRHPSRKPVRANPLSDSLGLLHGHWVALVENKKWIGNGPGNACLLPISSFSVSATHDDPWAWLPNMVFPHSLSL